MPLLILWTFTACPRMNFTLPKGIRALHRPARIAVGIQLSYSGSK
jgi:hypothetical protein